MMGTKHIYYTAFGETKTAHSWVKDPRCLIGSTRLYQTLRSGVPIEKALSMPMRVWLRLEERIAMLDESQLEKYDGWLSRNPDASHERKTHRIIRIMNPERVRAESHRYQINNREKRADNQRIWRDKNPDKVRAYDWARERRLNNTPEELKPSFEDLLAWKELYGQSCCYCGTTENLTLEHIVPISKGGLHMLDNILWACGSCNSSKHDETFIIWLWKKCNKSIHNNEN